jgi:alpha-D-xyloside xylohydrolase
MRVNAKGEAGLRRSLVLVGALLAACDGEHGAASDAGGDDASPSEGAVEPPQPFELHAEGPEGRTLEVHTDPFRFRVERADGTTVLQSPGAQAAAVAIGAAPGGAQNFHDPQDPTPRGVSWHPLSVGAGARNGQSGIVRDAQGRRARIEIAAPSAGVFRLQVRVQRQVDDAALMRLQLAADDGSYHGLGERFGHADARGHIVPMQLMAGGTESGTNEHHVPVPFLVSSNGYGVFVETREAGAFDVAATDPQQVRATFEGGELDVWLFVRDDPRQVVAQYSQHTGLPRLPPRWAFAPMHWRNEWEGPNEVLQDAERIREENIPCTTMWIDNPWEASYNDHRFDRGRFPEPEQLLSDMQQRGYVPLLWSTPYLDAVQEGEQPSNRAEELFLMARERDWLVDLGDEVYLSPASPGARGAMMDFTSDEALTFWKQRLAPLVEMGVRAFKLDYGEDILVEVAGSRPGWGFSDGRTGRQMHNVYNLLYHEPYRRALDEGAGEQGGFLLVRGSTWGGQTVADIVWPGDLDNDFREGLGEQVGGLPAAITALQSLASSGFPHFGSDTGGYRGGQPSRQALLRWAEHTAFTPILQLGGAGEHHNPWLYDEQAGDLYRTLARAHMSLVPYFRMNAIRASEQGYPPVSPPALAYPDDPGSHEDPYAYMLGPDLFVAPVVEPGVTERSLHLPPGTWVHWFTGESFGGPADVTVDAPLGTPPVFIRQGAVIPLLPEDLDTLVEVDDPELVDPSRRPWLRARILPAEGQRRIETEEGIDLTVEHRGDALAVTVTPDGTGLEDLRMRIDLAHAGPSLTSVDTVRSGGTELAAAPDAASVRDGCDGVCWFRQGQTLWLSVRSPEQTQVRVQ